MDSASSIEDRLKALEYLHENGIYTVLFMSPMFPGLTDYKAIIERTKAYVDEYWFENLNLRGSYKEEILSYIEKNYADLYDVYKDIYVKGKKEYWAELAEEIEEYCEENEIRHVNYFYHEELVKGN